MLMHYLSFEKIPFLESLKTFIIIIYMRHVTSIILAKQYLFLEEITRM